MKFIHTADWHIGRTLNGYSLLQEQNAMFDQILNIAQQEKVDGIIIAGDLYDRAVPPVEAVIALNTMLEQLNLVNDFPLYMITGNHDSAKRMQFGQQWYGDHAMYLATDLVAAFQPITVGTTQIFLLPYLDPMDARVYYKKQGWSDEQVQTIRTLNDALQYILPDMVQLFDPALNHILVTHFAVSANLAEPIERFSETLSQVGGLATISNQLFADFDYVALGHIHTRHASPSATVRYAGSPVKFNVKEAQVKNGQKGVEVVEINDHQVKRIFHPLIPQTDLIVLSAPFETLLDPDFYQNQLIKQAYFAITVEDFDRVALAGRNIRAELQNIYGTVVELEYQTPENELGPTVDQPLSEDISPEQAVDQFYQKMVQEGLTTYQQQVIAETFTEITRED